MKTEPIGIIAMLVAIVQAGILMAVQFGLTWTVEQQAGVMGFVLAIGVLANWLISRNFTFSAKSVKLLTGMPASTANRVLADKRDRIERQADENFR